MNIKESKNTIIFCLKMYKHVLSLIQFNRKQIMNVLFKINKLKIWRTSNLQLQIKSVFVFEQICIANSKYEMSKTTLLAIYKNPK